MTFDEVWSVARAVRGFFSEEEAYALFDVACHVPRDETIVEVGCYRGRSTVVLAASGRRVVTFDPMQFGQVVGRKKIDKDDLDALRDNLIWWTNVLWRRKTSHEVGDFDEPIGLLHIDGCHDAPWPRDDYVAFEPFLVEGARVFFHDYVNSPGVKNTVDALVVEKQLMLLQVVSGSALCRADLMEADGV